MSSSAKSNVQESVDASVEQGKRAFALRKYEQAIEHYATALEIATKALGEDAPETADLYFAYGRALLENAISQNAVLGKEQPAATNDEDDEDDAKASGNRPILSFSGDGEDPVLDLTQVADDDESDEEGAGDDDGEEPEDDFNAAWEVLDLARAIYDRQLEDDDDEETRLKLADTLMALGDISLETEKFDQAITDYDAALTLKLALLPTSSRHIAEAHYKYAMALDLTSGRLGDAISHVEKAIASVETRLAELRTALSGQFPATKPAAAAAAATSQPESDLKGKGKGKAVARKLVRDDLVEGMSKAQIEAEIKELDGLKADVALKLEELTASPEEQNKNGTAGQSAPELAAKALDSVLNANGATVPAVVNDLTSIVKKKKKTAPPPAVVPVEAVASSGKRKAESLGDEEEASATEKKARLEDAMSS